MLARCLKDIMNAAASAATTRTRSTRHGARGFTLIELMVALSILAVTGFFAIPAMRTMLLNSRLTSLSNDLLASLMNARTEAVKRQSNTVVCAVLDPTAAAPACTYAGGTSWIVFADTNGNWQWDAGEPIIERHPAIDTSIFIRADGQSVTSFSATGFATPSGLITAMRNITLCDSRGVVALAGSSSTARAVTISPTGRARVVKSVTDVNAALVSASGGAHCP